MMLTIMMSLKNPWMILVSMKDKLSNIGQEAPTANFQEQINPIQDTTNKPLNSFAEQAHASFPQINSTS